MLKYSIKRVILALITAFIILTLTFFLVKSLGITDTTFGSKENVKFAFFMKQYYLGYVVYFEEPTAGYGKLLAHVSTLEQEYYFYEILLWKFVRIILAEPDKYGRMKAFLKGLYEGIRYKIIRK